ncbi:MAG: hypothetical protein VX874_15145 [Pseudomonadota bacterium]|nr:hypothetical protein [Pseudomonadota bacterium]
MKTKDCSPEEMNAHVAYFKDLIPNSLDFLDRENVPLGAFELMTAKKSLLVAASERKMEGQAARPAIDIPPGVSVFICETPVGNGPELHAHMRTRETFMCLSGRYEIRYGRDGEHVLELGPMDTVSVPNGVMRSFKNIADSTSYLLVLIHETGDEKALSDVYMKPELAKRIADEYGVEAVRGLERLGNNFTADEEEASLEHAK